MAQHSDNPIQILLATYNGSRYLDGFLDSLMEQDVQNWSLLVRDDGSSDGTTALLERWRCRLGARMEILPDSGTKGMGVAGNFSRLLGASTAPYLMFADQDDVWHRNKISLALAAMRGQEAETGSGRPILIHTDLALVDEDNRPLARSYWGHQGIIPRRGHALGHMVVENIASGCTMMLNRALADLAGEIPRESRFHDWWVSMVAAAFGVIVSLPEQTIDWRRHAENDSDITSLSDLLSRALTGTPQMRRRLARLLEESRPRVRVFLERYRDRLRPQQIMALEEFLRLHELGFFARRRAILQHRLLFTSWSRSAGLLLLV